MKGISIERMSQKLKKYRIQRWGPGLAPAAAEGGGGSNERPKAAGWVRKACCQHEANYTVAAIGAFWGEDV